MALQASLSGVVVSQFREDNELINVEVRGDSRERHALGLLGNLAVQTENGRVPLNQIATLEYGFEEGIIWHRDRLPTVTIRADIADDALPATLVNEIMPTPAAVQADLPPGYLLEVGGTVEESARGQQSVNAGMPLFVLVVITLLMLQLRSMPLSLMVFVTAPLVALFLLLFQKPFGFLAMLGTIALAGMIMRNAVILVDQMVKTWHRAIAWDAIIESTVRRFRPIALTALTAVLAMIPLSRSVFFGPMAVAIMGGLIVATALTAVPAGSLCGLVPGQGRARATAVTNAESVAGQFPVFPLPRPLPGLFYGSRISGKARFNPHLCRRTSVIRSAHPSGRPVAFLRCARWRRDPRPGSKAQRAQRSLRKTVFSQGPVLSLVTVFNDVGYRAASDAPTEKGACLHATCLVRVEETSFASKILIKRSCYILLSVTNCWNGPVIS